MTEITPQSPAKTGIPLGILFGTIMILQFVISYILNIDPILNPTFGAIINVLNYLLLPVLFITLACNSYKKSHNGLISFGECLKAGVTLCVIAGLVYALFSIIFGLIFPEFAEEVLSKMRTVMIDQSPDLSEKQLEMTLSWTRKMMSPAFVFPITIVMFAFIGLIYSLIIGAIVKKEKPENF